MATLTIRGLDEDVHARLRVRAASHGRSMEAEARAILREAIARPAPADRIGTRIHQRFAAIGGVEVDPANRTEQPRVPELPA